MVLTSLFMLSGALMVMAVFTQRRALFIFGMVGLLMSSVVILSTPDKEMDLAITMAKRSLWPLH